MRSATDFLPSFMIMFMNLARRSLPYFGSGKMVRLGACVLLDIVRLCNVYVACDYVSCRRGQFRRFLPAASSTVSRHSIIMISGASFRTWNDPACDHRRRRSQACREWCDSAHPVNPLLDRHGSAPPNAPGDYDLHHRCNW